VVPPTTKALVPTQKSEKARPLKEAVHLTTAEEDYTLFSERVLIGRAPHCRVIVLDPLVSREHALMRISSSEVVIEDLRSANGVYVNNVRIYEPQQLFDSDRILVGTHEMCVFAAHSSRQPKESPRPVPVQVKASPSVAPRPNQATERADALQVLGKVADRLLAQGFPQEAERVLSDHLRKLLDGARSGLPVPPAMCATAARHALVLAERLHNGRWVNYAVELHVRAGQTMSAETMDALERALREVDRIDHVLWAYYIDWVKAALSRLGPAAMEVLVRLDRMKLPGLE
jgi:hypothetical protein